MADDESERSGSYRWRLFRAAIASYLLHMLLFGGLSVSKLDVASRSLDSLEPRPPLEPKRQADFRLEVPRSRAELPAHERPLDLPAASPEVKPVETPDRPEERNVAEPTDRPEETTEAVATSRPEIDPERPRDLAAAPVAGDAPERQVEATPTEASAAAEETTAAATVEQAAVPAAAPVAIAPRERVEPARVAARWRPREVALLERLTARAPDASSLNARDAAPVTTPPVAESIERQATADAAAAADARAEAIAGPAAAAATSSDPLAPSALETARRAPSQAPASRRTSPTSGDPVRDAPAVNTASSTPAATVARSARGDAPAATATVPRIARRSDAPLPSGAAPTADVAMPAVAATATTAGGGRLAPAAPAANDGGRRPPGRGTSALDGQARRSDRGQAGEAGAQSSAIAARSVGDRSGTTSIAGGRGRTETGGQAGGDGAGLAPRPLGREVGGPAAEAGPATVADTSAVATQLATNDGGGRTPQGVGPPAERLGPAVGIRGRPATGRSALSASRSDPAGQVDDGEAEGLSVSPADLATFGQAGRRQEGLPDRPAGPRSPERVAAAALPVDGRVRDVAEAFAGRSTDGGKPAGGIVDAEDLARSRAMVDRGLEFLARSQQPDGRWRLTKFAGITPADVPKLDSDAAATGLALLCFFGAGHDHFDGPHRDTVRRGLEFLISVQKPDGDLFVPADDLSNSCSWLYSHGIASIAICEAVGMTGDPLVKPAAEKACLFIAQSSDPTLGGWRYRPRSDADLSVSGWMLVALRAGDLAGVKTDPAALEGVRTLLAASSSASDPARFAYNARKADQRQTELSTACMTAVGALMRLHTGVPADDPSVTVPARTLGDFAPSYGNATRRVRDAYLWYYASQVLVHTGGEPWQKWYGSLVDTLEPEQRREGPLAGSWDPLGKSPDRWGPFGGRVYVTALHILALEVPWRHLPTLAEAAGR